jgi:multimeric flavodoxin WrbA
MPPLAILGSARRGGHTAQLLGRLIAGQPCEVTDLLDARIGPFSHAQDYPPDDFLPVVRRMTAARLTIFATPVYWYSYSAVMKNFIDRFSDLVLTHQDLGRQLRGRKFALLASGTGAMPERSLNIVFEQFCGYLGAKCVACVYARETGPFYDPAAAELVRVHLEKIETT